MGLPNREYNGHSNYVVWNVNLWIGNEPGLWDEWCRMGRKGDRLTVAEVEHFVRELITETRRGEAGCGKDIEGWARGYGSNLDTAIGLLDFDELRRDCWEAGGYEAPPEVITADVHGSRHEGLCRGCFEPVGSYHETWCELLPENQPEPEPEAPHVHEWGAVQHARFTGNPHRRCDCGAVTLDLDADDAMSEQDYAEMHTFGRG